MYERMLNKSIKPTIEQMTEYCGTAGALFTDINKWLKKNLQTEVSIVFPYGNKYGWGIAHKKNNKLICNVFAEKESCCVMLRLTDRQFDSAYPQLSNYAKQLVDNKYPCSNGGWIHLHITDNATYDDATTLLEKK